MRNIVLFEQPHGIVHQQETFFRVAAQSIFVVRPSLVDYLKTAGIGLEHVARLGGIEQASDTPHAPQGRWREQDNGNARQPEPDGRRRRPKESRNLLDPLSRAEEVARELDGQPGNESPE